MFNVQNIQFCHDSFFIIEVSLPVLRAIKLFARQIAPDFLILPSALLIENSLFLVAQVPRAEGGQPDGAEHPGHLVHERVHAAHGLLQPHQVAQVQRELLASAQERRAVRAPAREHARVREVPAVALLCGHAQRRTRVSCCCCFFIPTF